MLCWALVEQARHEHMSDEYKNRYNTIDVPPSPSFCEGTRHHHNGSQRTKQRGKSQADKNTCVSK